jgi:3-oxoacyl-[acyl-carrier-protein] synthase II
MNRVVITGVGPVTSIGCGVDSFWSAALQGKSNIQPIPDSWKSFHNFTSNIYSPLPVIDYTNFTISKVDQMQLDSSTLLALAATDLALQNAQIERTLENEKKNIWHLQNVDSYRSGVFIGTGIGGISTLINTQANHTLTPLKIRLGKNDLTKSESDSVVFQKVPGRFNPFSVAMIMPNATSSAIGIKYNLKGVNSTSCYACAAGTIAIGTAFQQIKNGVIDFAIAGGTEYLGDPFGGVFRAFDLAKTLVSNFECIETANRPFDKKRSGFLFSEGGAAVLVLESLEHALSRGATIIAEISAFHETFDAYNCMSLDPSGSEIVRLHTELLKSTAINPHEIQYINAHGTGTILNDETESSVIEKLYGKRVYVNSTKSLIGHTLGASGAIEAMVTALSIKHKTTHISKNCSDPVRNIAIVDKVESIDIQHAISQSFAFGGHNAALLFKEYLD